MSITGFNCEICGALDNYPYYYEDLPIDLCRTCARDVGAQTPGEYEALLRQREKHAALERRIADASGRVTYVGYPYPGVLKHAEARILAANDRYICCKDGSYLSLDAENDTWMFGTFDDTTDEGKVMLTAFALKLDPDVGIGSTITMSGWPSQGLKSGAQPLVLRSTGSVSYGGSYGQNNRYPGGGAGNVVTGRKTP